MLNHTSQLKRLDSFNRLSTHRRNTHRRSTHRRSTHKGKKCLGGTSVVHGSEVRPINGSFMEG